MRYATRVSSPVEAARALAPLLRGAADEAERARRLPAPVVAALSDAGLFALCVPRAFGGAEAEPAVLIATIEALAQADGAAGWCAMIGSTSSVLAGYLAPADARAIYRPGTVSGGAFAPQGKAVAAGDGFRVSGRWAFASGCQHCAWLMGGAVVLDDGAPRRLASGAPDTRLFLFPAGDAEIIDTWDVSGLRGTGSHDIAVRDVVVPGARSVSLVVDRPTATGPLYAFPVFGLLALGIAAVALGIARRALDELEALAADKVPSLARRPLRDRPVVQTATAEAEATLAAARAFVLEAVDAAWRTAAAGDPLSIPGRARLRLAATHAVRSAARVVDVAYDAGGGSAIYAKSPLQRCFRDVHAVTQHTMVQPSTFELVGRVLLGADADTSML